MASRPWLGILVFVWGFCAAAAEEAASKPPPPNEKETLEAYGRENSSCKEWSDGCAVCMRQGDAEIACSLPGIACQPSGLICRQQKAVKEPEKPAR